MSTATTAPHAVTHRTSGGYQILLVAILSLNFGVVFFDRNALNFLMPFVQPDLGLSNAQVGLLASALSLTWAVAALVISRISDKTGSRKGLLILCSLAFSLCSVVSGLATSFVTLLAARLLMGVAEGGIMPISHSLVAATVKPEQRGLAMGVTQNFGSNFIGTTVGAVALPAIALSFGWRESFFLSALPGLVFAALIWLFVQEPPRSVKVADAPLPAKMPLRAVFLQRNVWVCCTMGVLLVGYLVTCWTFMPLFLVNVRGYTPESGVPGWLMGALGLSATVNAFLMPAISDRIGRKPVMLAGPLLSLILPLGAMFFGGSLWLMAGIFFVGWAVNGIFPLFMGTIPAESVDPAHTATAMGLAMGLSELIGGVLAPIVSGWLADSYGLSAPLWVMVVLAAGGAGLALLLRETAPVVVGRRAAVA